MPLLVGKHRPRGRECKGPLPPLCASVVQTSIPASHGARKHLSRFSTKDSPLLHVLFTVDGGSGIKTFPLSCLHVSCHRGEGLDLGAPVSVEGKCMAHVYLSRALCSHCCRCKCETRLRCAVLPSPSWHAFFPSVYLRCLWYTLIKCLLPEI